MGCRTPSTATSRDATPASDAPRRGIAKTSLDGGANMVLHDRGPASDHDVPLARNYDFPMVRVHQGTNGKAPDNFGVDNYISEEVALVLHDNHRAVANDHEAALDAKYNRIVAHHREALLDPQYH